MQHCCRCGRGRVGLGRPGVKRKERDQNPEAKHEQDVDGRAGLGGTGRGQLRDLPHVKSAIALRQAQVETNQPDQQNEAAEGQVGRHFPGGGLPVARSPDADQQECRDERQLMEHVKEKCVDRGKRADGPRGDEEQARIEPVSVLRRRPRDTNRRQRDRRRHEENGHAQSIRSQREVNAQ